MGLRRALADRIYYGWVIAFACLLASMAVFGTTYAFGVFYDAFIDEFAATRAVLAATFGLQTALIYVGSVAAGRAVDRVGARRVAAGSGLVLTAGLAWTALARSFVELLVAFGVVAALGMAGLYVVGYATVPYWFRRRRGTAAGIASAGLGVGLVVVPPGADYLIGTVGWREAMLAVAGTAALLSAVVALLFVDDPDDVGADRSVEFGEDAVGEGTKSNDANASETADDETGDDGRSLRAIAFSAPFVAVFVGWVFVFAPMFAVMSHVVVHASETGIGRSVGVLTITTIGVTTTICRLGIGAFADRVGRTWTFVGCAAVMGAAVVGIAGAPSASVLLIVAVIFGIGYGGCGGLLGPQTADLFGDEQLNTLFGVLSLSFAVSGLLAPPAAGYLFDLTGQYTVAFVGLGVLGIVGAGCVAVAGRLATE